MKINNFKLHEITTNISIFPSFSLSTSMQRANGDMVGESFLILNLEGHPGPLVPIRMAFDEKSFRMAEVSLNHAVVLQECVNQAVINFNIAVWNGFQKNQRFFTPTTPVVKELESVKIFAIWTMWKAQAELSAISKITEHAELESLINTVKRVPLITREMINQDIGIQKN